MNRSFQYLILALFVIISSANDLPSNSFTEQKSDLSDVIINPECRAFFKYIGEHDSRNPKLNYDKQVLSEKSGHNLNDLGNYHGCISNTSYNYFVIQIGYVPQNVSGFVGLCSPSYCNSSDWSNETKWLQDLIPTIGGPNLSNLSFAFIDPMNLNVHADTATFLVVTLIGVLVALVLVSTFCANFLTGKPKQAGRLDEGHYTRLADSQLSGTTAPLMILGRYPSGVSSLTSDKDDGVRAEREEVPLTFFGKILQSFDISKNFDEVIGKEERADHDKNIQLWSGIKAFTLIHVVLGNVFLLSNTSKNAPAALYFAQRSWMFLGISAAAYGIDMFFFISGFLAAYHLLGLLKGMSFGLLNLFRLYFHRWIRLWPTYIFVLLFFWKVVPFMTNGPIWFQLVNFSQSCNDSWWKNFLFVDNIFPSSVNQHCMIWGLSAPIDFQMFLILPFVVWIYIKDREYGKTALWMLILIGIIASYSFAIQANLPFTVQIDPPPNVSDIFNNFVSNPLIHWSPYFIGAYAGLLYRNYKNGENNFYRWISHYSNRTSGYIISGIAFALLMVLIFPLPRTEQVGTYIWPQSLVYFWASAGRPLIVLCVWFFLLPCLTGYLKPIRNFLNWGVWKILANLVYPIYLVHFIVILYIISSDTQFGEFSLVRKTYFTITILIVSMVWAILLHLLVEKPFIALERGMFAERKDRFCLQGLTDSTSIVKV